jgi:hypothetical protein
MGTRGSSAARDLNPNDVVQGDGLVDGAKFMKTVGAARADGKAEVDLGEGADGHHGKMNLNTGDAEKHRQ